LLKPPIRFPSSNTKSLSKGQEGRKIRYSRKRTEKRRLTKTNYTIYAKNRGKNRGIQKEQRHNDSRIKW